MTQPNIEHFATIQRFLNNGRYEEAVDAINIVLSNTGSGPSPIHRELASLVPQLFPSLTNANDSYLEKCCKALEKMLQFTSVDTIIGQMEVQLKQGFEHNSPLVKVLCLKQLHRAVSDRRNLKLIGEVGIMKHGILLLADQDSAVVKQCHKTLLELASYDEGVMILYSDQGIKLMVEVAQISETIKYRVFDVIIDTILISEQALQSAQSASFVTKILEDLESPDILLRLNALENVSRLSDSPSAYTQLRNIGIFKGIGAWLGSNSPQSHEGAPYTVPSVIKMFAKLAQKQNVNIEQFCKDSPEYLTTVCKMIHCNDAAIKYACIDVVTVLNARADGKQALLRSRDMVKSAVYVLSEDATRGTDDIKDRCLVALAHVFSPPEVYIPDFETISEIWYHSCKTTLVKDTLPLLAHPSAPRQCAAASFLGNLVTHRYGLKSITEVPGWSERILDRSYCVDTEAQNKRYALVLAVKQSPIVQEFVDREIVNKFSKYANEGPHYCESEMPRVSLQL